MTVRFTGKMLCLVWLSGILVVAPLQRPAAAAGEEGCLTSKINSERQARGSRSLSSNSSLVTISRRHSARMSEDQRYYHNANLRNELPDGWRSEGENVGWATDCAHMHNFFINSPSHRKNILNPVFDQIGVGVVVDSSGKLWVTQVFVESSRYPGLSTQSQSALSAPPHGGPSVAEETKAPAFTPSAPQKKTPLEADRESSPGQSTARQPKSSPARTASSASKGKQTALRKEAGPQTLALQELLQNEPGWHNSALDDGPIVFDLESTV